MLDKFFGQLSFRRGDVTPFFVSLQPVANVLGFTGFELRSEAVLKGDAP